mgnify:CR=1 FL=1
MHAYYIDYILVHNGKKIRIYWKSTKSNRENQSEAKKKYFRITVKGGGCSGFKYNFSFDDKVEKDDILFEQTIIDKTSLEIISGSTVDFKEEMIGESFVINNPKASASCGCGLSFSV